jgi:UDP-N-acetylglucosamine 2-epimerase (non-hydrolysing)
VQGLRVICVAGARPNFVKIAPLWRALSSDSWFQPYFVHTGQHYDDKMSQVFLDQLGLPTPDSMLGVGSGSHSAQTAAVLERFEPVLEQVQPHVVIVVGDVNSTLACALAASKFRLRESFAWSLDSAPRFRPIVAHVEAGLRSGDLDMPEEINRRATDAISDLMFTTEAAAGENLRREGVVAERIHFVGNVMIDSLMSVMVAATTRFSQTPYALVTLHRPSNVDDPLRLRALLKTISDATDGMPIVFPVHPRTRASLGDASNLPTTWNLIEPLGYTEFVGMLRHAAIVCTDSGGVQEEATVVGTRCVTLRDSTERPVTVSHGSNRIAGTDLARIDDVIRSCLAESNIAKHPPPLWDGHAAPRIVAVIKNFFM